MVSPDEKVTKRKAENNLFFFNLVLLYVNDLFLSFVGIFDLKVVKSNKIEQNLFKNCQSRDAKTNH